MSRIAGGQRQQAVHSAYTSILSISDGYVYVWKFMAPQSSRILPVGTLARRHLALGAVMGAAQSAPQALQHCKTHAPSLHSHTMDRLFGKSKEKAPKPTLDDVAHVRANHRACSNSLGVSHAICILFLDCVASLLF